MNNVKLIYPQWQGGDITRFFKDTAFLDESQIARGYYLGAKLLDFLAPKNANFQSFEVPISLDFQRKSEEEKQKFDQRRHIRL